MAAYDQGAQVTNFDPSGSQVGHKESVADTARVLGRMFDAIQYRGRRQSDVEETCAECSQTQGTLGGCRSTAYAFHGRFTASDPYCIHNNQGVDLNVLPQWLLREDT